MLKIKTNTKEIKIKFIIVCLLMMIFALSFFFANEIESVFNLNETYSKNQVSADRLNSADYEVTYLDVGQGNSAFVKLPDQKTLLIDGGNTVHGTEIVEFLKSKNISKIDYMIATHADADHIGGLLAVLENFEVKNIFRPFQIAGTGTSAETFIVSENEDLKSVYLEYQLQTGNRSKISRVTSEIYLNFIESIYSEFYFENGKKLSSSVTVFYDGLKFGGTNYEIEFFAPLVRDDAVNLELKTENTKGYATVGYGASDSNSNSAIFMLSCYGETFLFTGDAPFSSGDKNANKLDFEELDFLESLTKIEREKISKVSVFIAGHHGSKYSSSQELLNLINPKFVVVSVSKDNTYEHPSSEFLERVKSTNRLEEDYLLLTLEKGNISFSSIDGTLKYSTEHYERNALLTISWYELGTIIFISISYIIVLIKPKEKRRF